MPGPNITVPNRPFATETITGLMLPDGVFESSLGHQRINAHFRNLDSAPVNNVTFYIEGVSNPSIQIIPLTYFLATLPSGGSALFSWDIDVSAVPPGVYQVSIIAKTGAGLTRIIKKIFVTRVQFNPVTRTFTAQGPEGRVEVAFRDLIKPENQCCPPDQGTDQGKLNFLEEVTRLPIPPDDPNFAFCLPGYLPHLMDVVIVRTPPFAGQYGDYPFQDFAWKVFFGIIAAILVIAAAVDCAIQGHCKLAVLFGTGGGGGDGTPTCCGVQASGGGTNKLAAGLLAAAATAASIALHSDGPDPIRRGQEHTSPAAGELTIQERLQLECTYPEPVRLGTPFTTGLKWDYTRVTTGASYTFSASDSKKNTHILSRYEIDAPNVIRRYQHELFIIRGRFFDATGQLITGDNLLVQCILTGPAGQYRVFKMQDNGISPDSAVDDGTYTGQYQFAQEKIDPDGLWKFFVIAQDINTAQPTMSPEQQAEIVGGLVRTHQLSINIGGGTCPLVPDGDVNVIG